MNPLRLVRSGDDTHIGRHLTSNFPILLGTPGGVFEPGYQYLREISYIRNLSPGSVADEAYIICGWINYLIQHDKQWDNPSSRLFIDWVRDQGRSPQVGAARRRRQASVIFAFYEHHSRQPSVSALVRTFVDDLSEPIPASALSEDRAVRRSLRLRFGRDANARTMRPTPSPPEVEAISATALGRGSGYLNVRNWLLVRTAYETNLRTQGLASLEIAALDKMLREEGLLPAAASAVDFVGWRDAQHTLRAGIDEFERSGRRHFICRIREKGKDRLVRFPIALTRQLLEFIWAERADYMRSKRRTSHSLDASALWLSHKTGAAIGRGSIADLLAATFVKAGVKGSGHRLRAAHCVGLFRSMVSAARSSGGGKLDAEAVLDQVAQLMGHAHPQTLRPYLNAVLLEDLLPSDHHGIASS